MLRRYGWLFLALTISLAGCGAAGVSQPTATTNVNPPYLQRISAPRLQWLSTLSRIPQSNGAIGGEISGLTLFQRPGTTTTQAIVRVLDTYYQLGEDGSDLHRLSIGTACAGDAAVSPDANWLACYNYPDTTSLHSQFQMGALTTSDVAQFQPAGLYGSDTFNHAVWSPDGQYLAVAVENQNTGCQTEVEVLYAPPSHDSLTRAVVLNSDFFGNQQCTDIANIQQLQWMSSTQLSIALDRGVYTNATTWETSVSLADAFKTFSVAESNAAKVYPMPVALTIPTQQFQKIYSGDSGVQKQGISGQIGILLPTRQPGQQSPNSQSDFAIALSTTLPEVVYRVDLRTDVRTPLFTLANPAKYAEYVSEFGWTPDGHSLYVVVDGQLCNTCHFPASDVYLYSMDAA